MARLAPLSFTTLPVCINKLDRRAQTVSRDFVHEWKYASRNGVPRRWSSLSGCSPVGHWAMLQFPECPPEYLDILTKMHDYTLIDDDLLDPSSSLEEFVLKDTDSMSGQLSRDPNYRELQISLAFEVMEICHDVDAPSVWQEIKSACTELWRARANSIQRCATLDEYLAARYTHFGMHGGDAIISLILGLSPTAEEKKSVEHIVQPLRKATMLANDYFSYSKEKRNEERDARPLVNAVSVVMAEHNVSEDEALVRLREKILELEKAHTAAFESLDDGIPVDLRRYLVAVRDTVAGFHVWASCTPRYHGTGFDSSKIDVEVGGWVTKTWGWITTSLGF
ncbi:isoprenoid synthase domain-containing protein [Aspergillus aurantiobrunneus]